MTSRCTAQHSNTLAGHNLLDVLLHSTKALCRSHNCCRVWRMCPHQYHPSPDFQSLMVPLHEMNHYQQHQRTGAYAGMCWLDGFLMWPVPHTTQDCSGQDPNLDLAAILTKRVSASPQPQQQLHQQEPVEDTTRLPRRQKSKAAAQRGSTAEGERPRQTFCIHHS
jgi:hypothetical protein